MIKIPGRVWKICGCLLLAVAVLAAIVPYLPTGVFRAPVERALARSLNRKVTVKDVRFTFFPAGPVPGPGFALENVTIDEDPRAGIEPFAHMEELGASIRILSLLRGKLELSGINLGDASINLVQTSGGEWNFQYLLSRTDPASTNLPAIRMRSGRVNFKFADTKSVFYFNDADMDISPVSANSSYASGIDIRFGGAPARTDHSARDFGRFYISGTAEQNYHKLDLTVELERSSLEETLRLIDPRGFGVHGVTALTARLSGEPNSLQTSGTLQIGDVHRWDLLPTAGGVWKIPFAGVVDLKGEQITLLSTSADATAPVSVRFRAQNFLKNPEWDTELALNKAPLVTLFEVARHMGALPAEFANWVASNGSPSTDADKDVAQPAQDQTNDAKSPPAKVPVQTDVKTEDLKISGTASGSAKYNRHSGVMGTFALDGLSFALPRHEPLQIAVASIEIAGESLHMRPAQVEFGENQMAEIELNASVATPRTLDLKLTTRGLNLNATDSLGLPAVSFVRPAAGNQTGNWRGSARYRVGDTSADAGSGGADNLLDTDAISSAGVWSGEAELQNCRIAVDGIADPVEIAAAGVRMDARRISLSRIKGKTGAVAFTGSMRIDLPVDLQEGDDAKTVKSSTVFDLVIHEASATELERLLSPSIARGRGGLLARTLRLGAGPSPPTWLKTRTVKGSVLIETLALPVESDPSKSGDWKIVNLRGQVQWDGAKIHVSEITGSIDPAVLYGDLDVDIAAPSPKYQFTGSLVGIAFHGGSLDLAGSVASEGTGAQLLANAHGDGSLQGHSIAFAPDAEFRSVSGAFELKTTTGTRWKLTNVEAAPMGVGMVPTGPVGGTATSTLLVGSGGSQEDGRLALDLARGDKVSHYVGSIFTTGH